ncbi:MAG TPA: V-type ATP synthase subunit D [Jiangellaceae bacterium]
MSVPTARGRAGRLRLRHRLAAAARASELLDRKRRILAGELDRLGLEARRTGEEWERSAREARAWLQRAEALDGQRALAAATPAGLATVAIQYGEAMGVRYPVHTTVTPPAEPVRAGSSALSYAADAHRRALAAAVQHAAISRAEAMVAAELAHTRTRQRAIDNRWIPQLENALRILEMQLDELDREENVRVRWAANLIQRSQGR